MSRSPSQFAAGSMSATLDAAGGDWDLAIFQADSGQVMGGSAYRGSHEVASGLAVAGERLVVQACRRSGSGSTATLSAASTPIATTKRRGLPGWFGSPRPTWPVATGWRPRARPDRARRCRASSRSCSTAPPTRASSRQQLPLHGRGPGPGARRRGGPPRRPRRGHPQPGCRAAAPPTGACSTTART